jgi:tetratricopeptide (TPR) repeat protein
VERAIELSSEDLALGRESIGFGVMVWTYAMAPWLRIYLGQGAGQMETLEKGIAIARREQEHECLGWIFGDFAMLEFFSGSLGRAEIQCLEALEDSERMGSPFSKVFALRSLALARMNRENWAGALEGYESSLRVIEDQRTAREAEPEILAWYALALVGAGETDRANEAANRALVLARQRGARLAELDAHFAIARAANAAGDPEAADAALNAAAEVCEECGARAWEPILALERAECARRRGDAAATKHALQEALRVSEELAASGHAERARREMESL